MRNAESMQSFSATVWKIDINPYVKVPDRIVRQLHQDAKKVTGPIPVLGKLQDQPFSTTVVKFRGIWRLYLNTSMRRAASVEVGDRVRVEVRFDGSPRTVPAPRKFTMALSKNTEARTSYQQLAASRQKEILRYLNSLKQRETLERNIEKIIQSLEGKKAE